MERAALSSDPSSIQITRFEEAARHRLHLDRLRGQHLLRQLHGARRARLRHVGRTQLDRRCYRVERLRGGRQFASPRTVGSSARSSRVQLRRCRSGSGCSMTSWPARRNDDVPCPVRTDAPHGGATISPTIAEKGTTRTASASRRWCADEYLLGKGRSCQARAPSRVARSRGRSRRRQELQSRLRSQTAPVIKRHGAITAR